MMSQKVDHFIFTITLPKWNNFHIFLLLNLEMILGERWN